MNKIGKVAVALAMALVTVESFGARLPVGYREVAWIESTGQQSINLGFTPNKDTTGLVMSFNSGTYTDTTAFFCTGWGGDRYLLCQMSKKYMFFGSGNSVADACPGCDLSLTIVPDGTGNGTLTIDKPDDPEWKPTPATVGLSCSGNLQLFGAGGGHMSTFRLYRLTITERTVTPAGEDGEEETVTQRVVHDFYPCYREADGEIGLYDVLAADPVAAFKADANKAATKFEKGEPVRGQDGLAVLGTPEDFGEVTPAYGTTDGHAAGESFVCSAPALYTNAEGTVVHACRGYTVYTNGIEYVSGTENCFTYTHPDCAGGAMLVWQWELAQYKLDVDVAGDGTVDFESQFVAAGEIVTVTATPNDGWAFWRWEGTAAEGSSQRYAKSISVSVDKAKTLTARFSELAQLPKTLYVSPGGAGTKDGTSWENASDDLVATYNYAAVGATADNPREVRLAAGVYLIAAPIEMRPYVHVIGATDGETILSGDLSGTNKWNADPNVKVLENGELTNIGRYSYATDVKTKTDLANVEYGFKNAGEAAAQGALFKNLSFTGFGISAIYTASGLADGLTVDTCRFIGNGTKLDGGVTAPVHIDASSGAVSNSYFRGNWKGVIFSSTTRQTVNYYENNVCEYNEAQHTYSGSLHVRGMAEIAEVRNCTFRGNNHIAGTQNQQPGVAISFNQQTEGTSAKVTNCDFLANRSGSKTFAALNIQIKSGSVKVENCRFVGNFRANAGSAALAAQSGSVSVESCYFGENSLTGSGTDRAGSVCNIASATVTFNNCTFEKNACTNTLTRAASTQPFGTVGCDWQGGCNFVNCLFVGNTCKDADGTGPEIDFTGHYNAPLTFVNTVMWNDDADYWPVRFATVYFNTYIYVSDSAFRNFSKIGDLAISTYKAVRNYWELTEDPGIAANTRTSEAGVVARGLSGRSAYHKSGRSIWRGTDGNLYCYDDTGKNFHNCKLTGNVTVAKAAEVGVTLTAPLAPDAFGEPRKAKLVALGPLNALPGLMLLVK